MLQQVPHDTALSDLAPTNLELRFDQNYYLSGRMQKRRGSRQDLCNRNKRNINNCQVERFRKILRFQIAGIRLFPQIHTLVVPKGPNHLIRSAIDSDNLCGTVFEKTISESAGR